MCIRDRGRLVSYAQEQEKTLETLTLDEYKSFSDEFEEDIYEAISLETCVKQRKVIGGPAPEIVAAHIEHVKAIQKMCIRDRSICEYRTLLYFPDGVVCGQPFPKLI